MSAQERGSRRRGERCRRGARKGFWDGGAPASNRGSPLRLSNLLERSLADADSHELSGASGVPPAPLHESLFAESAQSVSASPSLSLYSFSAPFPPSLHRRPGFRRASLPVHRGLPPFHSPLPDTIPPRFGTARVGSGRPGAPAQGFVSLRRRVLDLGRWRCEVQGAATRRLRPSKNCDARGGVGVAASHRNPAPPPPRSSRRARPLSRPEIPGWQMRVRTPGPAEPPEPEKRHGQWRQPRRSRAPRTPGAQRPLPLPGLRVSERKATAALRPPGRTAPSPQPFRPRPHSSRRRPGPRPAHLASRWRLGVGLGLRGPPLGSHLAPSRTPLAGSRLFPPAPRSRSVGLRATSRRASSSSLAQGLGSESREAPEPARVPGGFGEKPALTPKAREE